MLGIGYDKLVVMLNSVQHLIDSFVALEKMVVERWGGLGCDQHLANLALWCLGYKGPAGSCPCRCAAEKL